MDSNQFEIKGITGNSKSGAVVVSNQKVYFVDGLTNWEDTDLGKEVIVRGSLKIEVNNPYDLDQEIKQQVDGEKRIILNPDWKFEQ